jgi:hypothetical protein
MSASDLRDAFNMISLPGGVRCTAARLTYCDADGSPTGMRNHQRIAFDTVKAADNSIATYQSDPLPPGSSVLTATQTIARKAIGQT